MKVCSHHGLVIAVLTRNEHCPPHVHVGTPSWEARFTFSFWHQGVRLWDVVPLQDAPTASVLEDIRLTIKQAPNIRRARELWWSSRQTLCLDRQLWDEAAQEAVSPRDGRLGAVPIVSSRFDATRYRTILHLAGHNQPLEIAL
jgi:hypothetical protein